MGGVTVGQQPAAARATSEDTVTALHEAIGVISSVCDYAQSDDAQGFNAVEQVRLIAFGEPARDLLTAALGA